MDTVPEKPSDMLGYGLPRPGSQVREAFTTNMQKLGKSVQSAFSTGDDILGNELAVLKLDIDAGRVPKDVNGWSDWLDQRNDRLKQAQTRAYTALEGDTPENRAFAESNSLLGNPRHGALLMDYLQTRDPAVFDELRKNVSLTPGRAKLENRQQRLAKDSNLAAVMNATFGEGAGHYIIEAGDPLEVAGNLLPMFKGAKLVKALKGGSKLKAAGEAITGAVGETASELGSQFMDDPTASWDQRLQVAKDAFIGSLGLGGLGAGAQMVRDRIVPPPVEAADPPASASAERKPSDDLPPQRWTPRGQTMADMPPGAELTYDEQGRVSGWKAPAADRFAPKQASVTAGSPTQAQPGSPASSVPGDAGSTPAAGASILAQVAGRGGQYDTPLSPTPSLPVSESPTLNPDLDTMPETGAELVHDADGSLIGWVPLSPSPSLPVSESGRILAPQNEPVTAAQDQSGQYRVESEAEWQQRANDFIDQPLPEVQEPATQSLDTSHLDAILGRLTRERQRLAEAATERGRSFHELQVSQAEKELAAEYEFLGISPPQSDTDILAALESQSPEAKVAAFDGVKDAANRDAGRTTQSSGGRSENEGWVIRNKETGEVMMETHDPKKIAALNTTKYEAVTVSEHLASLNQPAHASPARRWMEGANARLAAAAAQEAAANRRVAATKGRRTRAAKKNPPRVSMSRPVAPGARGTEVKVDAEYMAAVEAGDMEKAQNMVDEAAKLPPPAKGLESPSKRLPIGDHPYLSDVIREAQAAEDRYVSKTNEIQREFVKRSNASKGQMSKEFYDKLHDEQWPLKQAAEDALNAVYEKAREHGLTLGFTRLKGEHGRIWTISRKVDIIPIVWDDTGQIVPLSRRFHEKSSDDGGNPSIHASQAAAPAARLSPAESQRRATGAAKALQRIQRGTPWLGQRVTLLRNRESLNESDFHPEDWHGFGGATEGFFDEQSGHVVILTDNIALRPGESLERAVLRVIVHERTGHAGLAALRQADPTFDARWNKLMEAVLNDGAVADEIAALRAQGYDHLTDSQLVEEWFARQVEGMTQEQLQALKPTSTLGKLWQWLKDSLNKLTGRFNRAGWTVRDLKEIMALSRQALENGVPRGTGGEARIKQSAAHLPPLWDYNARPANSNHGNASLNEVIASGVQGGRTRNLKLQVGTVPEGRMQAGKFVWMDDSFVTHALGEHGDERREDTQGQEALTAADFAMIPHVVSAPDAVTPNAAAGGKKGVRFEKRVNGTLVFVTAEPNAKGQLRAVTMRKRRVGRVMPSKAPASTSATGSLTPGGANATPQDRAERSFGKRVRADERLDPQMREHFGDPIVYDVAHNADTLAAGGTQDQSGPGASSINEWKKTTFGQRLKADDRLRESWRQTIGGQYRVESEAEWQQRANDFLEAEGAEGAYALMSDPDSGLSDSDRVAIGLQLILHLDEQIKQTQLAGGDITALDDLLYETAEWIEHKGTKLGQAVRVFGMWTRMSAEGVLRLFTPPCRGCVRRPRIA